MDDDIIYSCCFNDVEYFDSTPSAAIIILDRFGELFEPQIPAVVATYLDSHDDKATIFCF